MAFSFSPGLPRACLRPLQQPPLDSITIYNTATHAYLLSSDSLQRDYHLLTCRKHSLDEVALSAHSANASSTTNTSFEWDDEYMEERDRSGFSSTGGMPTRGPQSPSFCSLEDLHDYTTYAVYSPTEAASLVEALQREHGESMHVLPAVALLGAVRFTEGYYLVFVTERRVAGHIGVHRLFEAAQVDLVSLLLDPDWVAAQARVQRQSRRGEEMAGLSSFAAVASSSGSFASAAAASAAAAARARPPTSASFYRRPSSSATAAAAAYLFQRRPLEELYRQQFLSSLSRTASFFYSHSYDLTNTLQRNMLADGAAAAAAAAGASGGHEASVGGARTADGQRGTSMPPCDTLNPPRMQYVWNEYLLEPWQLPDRPTDGHRHNRGSDDDRSFADASVRASPPSPSSHPPPLSSLPTPHYPRPFARWRTFLVHGYITQRTVVVRRPAFHTLLITLIARVSKASAGVRYLRRGISSDGQVANHVEVEQIVSDEAAWNQLFTEGALSSYVQVRGSVPVRWYHPPTASRLLPKPPIVIGPMDAEWSSTCLHFQDLLRQYGGPVLAHDLLKRKEHHTRETALGDAYRAAAQALSAAVTRSAEEEGGSEEAPLRCWDVLQYESTDLRDLGPLAWNNMTAYAEHHFDQVHCFVCRRRQLHRGVAAAHAGDAEEAEGSETSPSPSASASVAPAVMMRDYAITDEDCPSVAVQMQCGVVRSNCLDCIDRTNLGQLFHGLHALGEQLAGLGPLRHPADLRDSPAVTELLLEMYLEMGDALATQYGGSAQVGAGVLHRGAGWDQLMGVKRLYNNVMGDRDKQEAIKLLLGRTQPHPRRTSRARNAAMHSPGQQLPFAVTTTATGALSAAPSLNASVTAATPGAAEAAARAAAAAAAGRGGGGGDMALVPSNSAPSLFSGLINAAARWWGEASRSSGAAASTTAAAMEAMRAAQHAAAEAEAEPDYYTHVRAGPRLPPCGLLASWWVQPLAEFAAWYATCGITVGSGRERVDLVEVGSGQQQGHRLSPSVRSPASTFSPVLSPRTTTTTTPRTATTTPRMGTMGDAFARHLLAAESEATQRWLLFVARWERQLCVSPGQRSSAMTASAANVVAAAAAAAAAAGLGSGSPGATSPFRRSLTASPMIDRSLAFPGRMAGIGVTLSSFGGGPTAVVVAAPGSVLRPSVSTWGVDESGPMGATMLSDGDSVALSGSASGAAAAADALATAEASSPFAPFSLTLTPSLFVQPWTVLRTTSHLLAVKATVGSHGHKGGVYAPVGRRGVDSAPLRLLYAWRREEAGRGASARSDVPRATLRDRPEGPITSWPVSQTVAAAVLRAVFGAVPAEALATSSWQVQPWRVPEAPHNHRSFPQTVHTSVFARQGEALAQLAAWETVKISDTDLLKVKAAALGDGKVRGSETPSRRVDTARTDVRRATTPPPPPTQQQQQQQQQRQAAIMMVASAVAADDLHFTAALLHDLYGAPEAWKVEQVVVALQRLLYPAQLPPAVMRVLCSSVVQPPLTGAEVVLQGVAAAGKEREGSTCEYWKVRLMGPQPPAVRRTNSLSNTPPPQRTAAELQSSAEADSVRAVAASLLSRLAAVLSSTPLTGCDGSPGERAGKVFSPASKAPPGLPTGPEAATDRFSTNAGQLPSASEDSIGDTARLLSEGAVVPLLQDNLDDVSSAARYAMMSADHPSHSESMRRLWLLCRLLQPLYAACVLTPSVLPDMLRLLFSDTPPPTPSRWCVCVLLPPSSMKRTPCHTRHHVRYTFALSPQSQAVQQQHHQQQQQQHRQQVRSQLAAGALGGVMNSKRADSSDRDGSSASPSAAASPVPPLSTSSPAMSVADTAPPASMHIPATLEVRHCCSSLELYTWCQRYRTRCRLAHALEKLPRAFHPDATAACEGVVRHPARPHLHLLPKDAGGEMDESAAAEASWRLLWWAVENNLVVPVARLREQTTLEILADETALFCVLEQVPRVAVNIERRSRAEVWRRARQPSTSQNDDDDSSRAALRDLCGGGGSAIYGVFLAAAFPIHRLTRRSALTDMVALSETAASLGLSAATRLQAYFRDYAMHGWTRSGLRGAGGGGGGGGSGVGSGNTGAAAAATSASTATAAVTLFGGGGVTTAAVAGTGGGGGAFTAIDAAVPVSPAEVVLHFSHLAEECLQSIQSVMVALRFVSLDALADDHALHAYISFFVNVYNAAYVVAWLTNVKELVSRAAFAAERMSTSSGSGSSPSFTGAGGGVHARPDRASSVSPAAALRSIDLLSLPTLCNTNIACFMQVYGVVIGHSFVSLAEIKYGILGGNRAPPYRDAPLWSSTSSLSLSRPPQQQEQQQWFARGDAAASEGARDEALEWQRHVPPHLRVALPEAARLASLRRHPQVLAALHLKELCDVYGEQGAAGGDGAASRLGGHSSATGGSTLAVPTQQQQQQHTADTRASSVSLANASFSSLPSRGTSQPPLPSSTPLTNGTLPVATSVCASADRVLPTNATTTTTTPAFARQRKRYEELISAWSGDVVRHVHFRMSLQLVDTYLPPPLFHLCHASDGGGYTSSSGGALSMTRDESGGVGGNMRSPSLDTHYRLDLDGERVPWYLQPILNTMPLMHPALQSSRVGVVYGVAQEEDGRARGMLQPQVSPDANGVILQPCRMWANPSCYLVGGDGMNGDEAIAHSFQLLQTLSGSYLGLQGYPTAGEVPGMVVQHLCAPLHHDDVLDQLHATEVAFRSALRSTDPQIFPENASSLSQQQQQQQRRAPLYRVDAHGGSHSSASSLDSRWSTGLPTSPACTAVLLNAMKPLLYEWCRATDQGMESISLLARPGSQLRVLLKVVRLLEESHASAESVRHLQRSVRDVA